jgi:hypothetical protein
MSLSELLAELGKARVASNGAYERYKELKGIEDQFRYELEAQLQSSGLKSVKGADFQAVITQKPSIVIKHPESVIDWLEHAPDIEKDQYIGLKETAFKKFAETYLKGTGEVIPGTDVEVKESLSIRANKRKE